MTIETKKYHSFIHPGITLSSQGLKDGMTSNFNFSLSHLVHRFQTRDQLNLRVGENEPWFLNHREIKNHHPPLPDEA